MDRESERLLIPMVLLQANPSSSQSNANRHDVADLSSLRFDLADASSLRFVKDSYGILLIRCCRGTNMVEAIHRLCNALFKHRSGIEMGDAKLAERRHRHNWDRAQKIYRDFPRVGHYDVWKIDILQKLVEQNTGESIFSGWSCVRDFVDSGTSRCTCKKGK